MRCIGTLEFVSDFHDKCHQTQRQLLLDKENGRKFAKDEIKRDFESDKENNSPNLNMETNENGNGTPAELKRKRNRVENKLEELKKIKYKDRVLEENKIPGFNDVENFDGNGAKISIEAKCSREIKSSPMKSKIRTKIQEDETDLRKESRNRDEEPQVPVTRPGRKQKGRKGSRFSITNEKGKRTEKKTVTSSNSEKNTSIRSNTAKPLAIEKVENHVDEFKEEQNMCHSFEARFINVSKGEINKSKRILPELVKIENFDSSNALVGVAALVKTHGFAQVISTPESGSESTAKSPRPGDEAGGTREQGSDAIEGHMASDVSKIVRLVDDVVGMEGLPKALMIRKSVIESVKNGKTFDTGSDLMNKNEISGQLTLSNKDDELMNVSENCAIPMTPEDEKISSIDSKEFNKNEEKKNIGNYRERRKKSEGQFGKLSELITNEQKEVIETLYTVNMDVVDEEEVCRNIKIFDKIKFKCEICGKTYPRMDKCQVHVWGHLNMKPYCCKSCDFVTLTVSNIRCHIRKRHLKIKPFQCNLCEKTYGTAVLLEEHINSHTGAKPYKCKLCDFATSNRQVLSYHKATHKPSKDISCNVCGKKFFSNCRMRAHMIVHNKDRNLMCKLCSTYLCNAEALNKHYQKVHSRDYICNICGVRTRSRKALTNHENVHSEAKYRCSLCSNVYKSKHMLKEHVLKHQGIRKYKCELCQKSFAQQSHIAAHMSVHMGKRYPCPGCNKLFNRRDNMRIHTRRCKIFKSNPDARDLWMSQNPTQPFEEDDRSIAASESLAVSSAVVESTENSKTDEEELETDDLGLIRINLLTGKTGYSNSQDLSEALRDSRAVLHDQGFDQFKSGDGEIIRIGEVDIFPLSNSNLVTRRNEGNTVITENILRPECF